MKITKILEKGNCGSVSDRGKEACIKAVSPRTETAYKAESLGEVAQHTKALSLGNAVNAGMECAYSDGLRYAVDCDLKSFFDTVNHGLLMNRLAKRINDQRVLKIIGRYLRAGVIMPDGRREATSCGVPQGGPLSPLLANVMLDDLDKELERRGLRFTRYADDFLIFVGSQSAAERVLGTVTRFLNSHLQLQVNHDKSKAAHINECSFLGFELSRGKLRWNASAVKCFKVVWEGALNGAPYPDYAAISFFIFRFFVCCSASHRSY